MKLADTSIHADHFVRGASAILISHYHGDHLSGAKAGSAPAPVYCSAVTGRLLTKLSGIAPERIRPIEAGQTLTVQDGQATLKLTAFDANHCPGALMFLVESDDCRRLYTGDFRMNASLRRVAAEIAGVDVLYLDGTYDEPHYRFPPQEEAIAQVLDLLRARGDRPAMVATYSLGKNRILEAAVKEFGLPFYATDEKRALYELIGMGHMVTGDRDATPFRTYARGYLEKYYRMSRQYRDRECVVVIPTGWAVDTRSEDGFHYVAYSEHCDWQELTEFRELVRPKRTVMITG